jgi:hypothetical protein
MRTVHKKAQRALQEAAMQQSVRQTDRRTASHIHERVMWGVGHWVRL